MPLDYCQVSRVSRHTLEAHKKKTNREFGQKHVSRRNLRPKPKTKTKTKAKPKRGAVAPAPDGEPPSDPRAAAES